MLVTDSERAEEYKSTLQYVLANLENRTIRPDSCATDKQLVKFIKWTLSEEGVEKGVEIQRSTRQVAKSLEIIASSE